MAVRELSDLRVDGTRLGQSAADLVGFFGNTPVDQPARVTAVNTTASTSTTNAFGYTTSTQADAIVTAINAIITNLEELGLMADA